MDPGNKLILKEINNFLKKNKNAKVFKSLGSYYFLNCLKYSDGIIGNSSSGLLESPLMKKGSINIGDRQEGRETCSSVINTDFNIENIDRAINKLYSKNFIRSLKKTSPHILEKSFFKYIFNFRLF